MAFNFPDPAVSTTATNPVTGAQYQWREDPGKWVLIQSVVEPPSSRIPFIGRYTLVAPDDFKDTPGTATIKTEAYEAGEDTFLSPMVKEFYFAGTDLDGMRHEQTAIYQSFDVTTEIDEEEDDSSNEYLYTSFYVKDKVGFTRYVVDRDINTLFNFKEGQLIYYRAALTGDYVKKAGGDTMEGQLIISGPRNAGDDVDNPDLVSSLKVLNIDNAQNSSLQLRHSGNAKIYIGDTDVAIASDIKFNRSQPSVVRTNVQDLLSISDREIAYLGESIEDEDLITKKYVDDIESTLQNEIIELEEEIDAIAPSVERGKWKFTAVGTVASRGQFTMYDAEFGSGQPTGLFKSAKSIWFNAVDSDGVTHAFGDVDDGELLEVFVDGSSEYGLYEVVGQAHDETLGATSFWVIDVNFVRTIEDTATVAPGETCRFKVFMAPTGGDATSFVMKAGDTMSGVLNLQDENDRGFYDLNRNKSYLKFTTKNSSGNEQTCALFQAGYSDSLVTSGDFMSSGSVYTRYNYFGGTATPDGFNSYSPFISLNPNVGELKYDQKTFMEWGPNYVNFPNINAANVASPGFSIEGKIDATTNSTAFFYVNHNRDAQDEIHYNGRTTLPTHIATKKYVDDNVRPIEIVAGNPSNPQVGDAWFSTNQNVFIIKIS